MEKTILVADDSSSIRDLLSFTLENAGYRVLRGVDGSDALQYFNGAHIDLIITDLYMPNLDGISLIKEVRAKLNYQFTPILLLTTESQLSKKLEAKAAGATGWIVKPFVQENLLEVVQRLIKK